MICPTNAGIGRTVIYYHHPDFIEDAVITSFDERFVFILFKGDTDSFPAGRRELHWKRPAERSLVQERDVGGRDNLSE